MSYQNILIVKLSAIGDVVHALPVATALKEAFPQARLTWVVEKAAYELVADHPAIDSVIIFEKSRCRSLSGLLNYLPGFTQQLKMGRFDLALDLQGLFKSGGIAFLSGASERLVYCHARELSARLSRKVCGPHQHGHVVEQYLDVVRAVGGPVTQVDFGIRFNELEVQAAKRILSENGWRGESYVTLVPGANWPNKRWPTLKFAQLAECLHEQGITCLITGGSGDRILTEEIRSKAKVSFLDLTGQTSLKQLAWVLKNAQVTVGGDTGPMHLSVAVGTPTVALMGPTDINRNGPYGFGHRAIVTSRDCVGCWRRKCEKGLDCLAAISVEEVYQAVRKLLVEEQF
jgi:heptosyltransferase-1